MQNPTNKILTTLPGYKQRKRRKVLLRNTIARQFQKRIVDELNIKNGRRKVLKGEER